MVNVIIGADKRNGKYYTLEDVPREITRPSYSKTVKNLSDLSDEETWYLIVRCNYLEMTIDVIKDQIKFINNF